MDKMLTMFVSQRQPPAETPAVTVQSPVAVSPQDDPTSPMLPEDASKDRLSSRQNIRITPDAAMRQSDEEGTLKPDVQLPCLDVVRDSLTQRGFSEAAAQRISIPQRGSTRTVYDGKWAEVCHWRSGKKKDPIRASVPVVADFLIHLFNRTPPLAVSIIRGYRSAIASTIPDGFHITKSKEISNLKRYLGIDRPITWTFYPKWSLKIVLNYFLKEPFEHISKCSLENLTLKIVFLVKLASGRRRSEIHALSVDPECFRFSPNLSQVSSHRTWFPVQDAEDQ